MAVNRSSIPMITRNDTYIGSLKNKSNTCGKNIKLVDLFQIWFSRLKYNFLNEISNDLMASQPRLKISDFGRRVLKKSKIVISIGKRRPDWMQLRLNNAHWTGLTLGLSTLKFWCEISKIPSINSGKFNCVRLKTILISIWIFQHHVARDYFNPAFHFWNKLHCQPLVT